MFFCAKLLFYCTQLRFVQLSNKAYDDDDDDDDGEKLTQCVIQSSSSSSA